MKAALMKISKISLGNKSNMKIILKYITKYFMNGAS